MQHYITTFAIYKDKKRNNVRCNTQECEMQHYTTTFAIIKIKIITQRDLIKNRLISQCSQNVLFLRALPEKANFKRLDNGIIILNNDADGVVFRDILFDPVNIRSVWRLDRSSVDNLSSSWHWW